MNVRPKQDIPLSRYTVLTIGGPAKFFYEAHSKEELIAALSWARQYSLPFFILGAGSNTVALDKGFSGIVIRPLFGAISFLGNIMEIDTGTMMPKAASAALKEGLSGFEWGVGIPGTIGGSIRGNAGCFGRSMGDVLESVTVYDAILGREKKMSNQDCKFSYRESVFKKHPEYVIISAKLSLIPANRAEIREKMKSHAFHRVQTQAIGQKCAGCMFKNIAWKDLSFLERRKALSRLPQLSHFREQSHIPAAFVLDELGLKGYFVGGAKVSEKHANFFVNTGGASSHDIAILASHCKEYVHRKTGLLLHEEVQYLV